METRTQSIFAAAKTYCRAQDVEQATTRSDDRKPSFVRQYFFRALAPERTPQEVEKEESSYSLAIESGVET